MDRLVKKSKNNIGILNILIMLGLLLVILPSSAIAVDSTAKSLVPAADCAGCHSNYANAIIAKQHAGTDNCLICHKGAYDTSTHQVGGYIGYIVTAATCNQAQCHSATSGVASRPVDAIHTGNTSRPADCTQCHIANTTKPFPLNTSLFAHDHNFTVEHNFYEYNQSGMPTFSNGGTGAGMFPYYTCTLTCHKVRAGSTSSRVERMATSWLQSKHAQSFTGSETNSCAKCKSPPNYNVSAPSSAKIAPADWQGIQCRVCHNLHNVSYSSPTGGFPLAYYNSTSSSLAGYAVYEQVPNATVLCENCHTGTTHNSKYGGTHKDTAGFDCADCHANSTFNNASHLFEVKNTTSGVTGCAVCHNIADHTFQFTSLHIDKVNCEACHDKTVGMNASGYAVSSDNNYGIYKDPATNKWSSYKLSHGAPATWPLHNISKAVNCNKCHNATSLFNGTIKQNTQIVQSLTCADCHTTYSNAVSSSMHNQTINPNAPGCTDCHTGYQPVYGHTSGTKGYIVNETNTCRNCHIEGVNGFNESHGIFHPPGADCTQCHFANTTQKFSLNASLTTHDHNLTVEHNFYEYNQSGMPLASNGGTGVGMFPYYTCTLTCHSGKHSLEGIASSWLESKHAMSRVGNETYDSKNSCAKCKSPPNYNVSASANAPIAAADWQGIQCRVCHNLHRPTYSMSIGGFPLAYYNSTASSLAGYQVYEAVPNATVLCENCHTGTTHNSKYGGTHKDTAGFDCADCHVNTTFNNESHLFEVKNTTSGVTGCAVCHNIADHTFQFTSLHIDKVNCEACHDKTVGMNASGYAVSSDNNYGIYKDPATNKWSSYKLSHGAPATWPLHNISKAVNCNKCHNATSLFNGTIKQDTQIVQSLTCADCHTTYSNAVSSSMHNQTINPNAPACTDCHTGYQPVYGHSTGTKGYIVNESNTCRNCHIDGVNGFYERHTGSSDCTQCHFANTTKTFSLNASLFTHDHNLTVEHNFYEYNLSGMPVRTNGGVGAGMFPYYTCTLTCHQYNATTGVEGKIDEAGSSWLQSKHAQSFTGSETNSCAKCKSPPDYNVSAPSSTKIAPANWQGIQCRVCHNLHDRRYPNNTGPRGFPIAFYNSTTSSMNGYATYDKLTSATQLCENCHTGTTHDSKFAGPHKDSAGFNCTDCHMNSTFNNELHLFEVKNTTSGVTGCEVCHPDKNTSAHPFGIKLHTSVDCVACHDQTFTVANATGYAVSSNNNYGIYKDPVTQKWTTYKMSHGTPATWPLHNISKSVDCDKCHGAKSITGQIIAPALGAPTPTVTTPTPTPTVTITPGGKGDVNGDGAVNVVDALFIAQYTVGLRTLTAQQLAAADVNGDGQVNIVDALFIAQYTVGTRTL